MGHDLGLKSRVHPKYKIKYRVKNWASYDRALVRRGDVTVWLSPEAIAAWKPAGVGKRGGQLTAFRSERAPPIPGPLALMYQSTRPRGGRSEC